MENDGRTVEVSGLPKDLSESRLSDKLLIHFLRKRNGGGEISSIKTSVASGSAIITFQEHGVAQRVVERAIHQVQLGDKEYELFVRLHQKETHPDELFVNTIITVDCSKLPGGKLTMSNMCKTFPEVKITFHLRTDQCTLEGGYSKVQDLTKSLLGCLGSQKPEKMQPFDTAAPSHDHREPSNLKPKDEDWQTEFSEQVSGFDPLKHVHKTSEGILSLPQTKNTHGRGADEAVHTDVSEDNFSMVIDSDIYRYIQKYCSKDYWGILDFYCVEVLDVFTNDITTIYLRLKSEALGQGMEDLRKAHEELGWLYQKIQAQLRKEQLLKKAIVTQGSLNPLDVVTQTFPKLLITEDEENIYFVGSGSSVSEAKQFLMHSYGTTCFQNSERHSSFPTSHDSSKAGSSSFENVHIDPKFSKEQPTGAKTIHFDDKFDEVMDTQKLFSNSDHEDPTHGEKMGEASLEQNGAVNHQQQEYSRLKDKKNHGEDFLKEFDHPPSASVKNDPLPQVSLSDSARNGNNALGTSLETTDSLRSTVRNFSASGDLVKSGQTLRGTSNLTSAEHKKEHNEITFNDTVPFRASEESSPKEYHNPNCQEVCEEVNAPFFLWIFMKRFQISEIEDIISDVEMTVTKTGDEYTLLLKGVDPSNVSESKKQLKALISKSEQEFYSTDLPLASSGVTNIRKVEEFCRNAMEKFDKVQIISLPKSIYIAGSEQVCMQVVSAFKDTFPDRKTETESSDEPSSTTLSSSASPGSNDDTDKIILKSDPPDQPQYKYMQDGEPKSNHYPGDRLQKDYATSSLEYRSDTARNREKQSNEVQEWEFDNLGQGNFQTKDTHHQQAPSPTLLGQNGERSAQLADSIAGHNQSGRSDLNLPTNNNKVRGTYNSKEAGWPALSTDKTFINDTNAIMEQGKNVKVTPRTMECPWCQGKVNPYCSTCSQSDSTQPTRAHSRQHRGEAFQDQPGQHVEETPGQICVCGVRGESFSVLPCGVTLCLTCQKNHTDCPKCLQSKEMQAGIKGTMSFCELSLSLPGNSKDTTLKISFTIPDGIQGKNHPNPGTPFQGGTYHAYLPRNETALQLLPALERAFDQGLVFTVKSDHIKGDRVVFGSIPLKTNIEGGLSRNGYPDSGYLKKLDKALKEI